MDSTLALVAAIVALTAALVHYHLKAFSFWSSRNVPGPRPWPLLGTNIYYLFGHKIDVDRAWRNRYGPTFGVYEGYRPKLQTTDNELLKQIFIRDFKSFTDRDHRFIYGPVQRNWLLWSMGEQWANQRALMSPLFSSAKIRLMLNSMSSCVDRFLTNVASRINSNIDADGHSTSPSGVFRRDDVSSLTLDVIATTFFGLKVNTYDLSVDLLTSAYRLINIPIARLISWLSTPSFLARFFGFDLLADSDLLYFRRLTQQAIDERRRTAKVQSGGQAETKSDIVSMLMRARIPDSPKQGSEQVFSSEDDREAHYNDRLDHKQLESIQHDQAGGARLFKSFTDFEIQGQMSFLFIAGFETTSTTISFCFLTLAHHPEVQTELITELKDKFNCSSDLELSRLDFSADKYSELADLKLLDAFISEVMRIFSPIIEIDRLVTEPNGVTIHPRGLGPIHLPYFMPISTNICVLHHDPEFFERPEEFDLTRFQASNRDKIKTCTFAPFGLGPRYCAGMRFALLEVKLALAKTIARYIVSPGSKDQVFPPKLEQNLVFLIAEDSSFRLTPRCASEAA